MAATAGRLVGLDVARALALLGMVATHVLVPRTPEGDLTWTQWLAGGRASALFAVLAGVSLALMSGRTTPVRGRERWAVTGGLAARAMLIAVLGLALGELDTRIAVILTYYGVLFLLGLPFLGLRAPSLAVLSVLWLVVAPLASHWLRGSLPGARHESPSFEQLDQPLLLGEELLLTGFYPALVWLVYLLAGMAVGRSNLARRSVQAGLLLGGLAVAVAATWLSGRLIEGRFDAETLQWAEHGFPGTTPPGRLDWLLLVAPHSGTPFDLAQTTGSALALIGGCLLVAGLLSPSSVRGLAVWFGAGTMTLTLYSLHVLMRTGWVWPPEQPWSMTYHVVVLGGVGAVFVLLHRRGPLEVLVGLPMRVLRRWAGNPRNRPSVRSA